VALSQVNLYGQVTGYITGIYFAEGTHVHKGQKLYSIDERLYLAAVDQAKANLRVDSGNLKQVQQDADRYIYLNKYNAVATQLVDHALISLQNAKDSVRAGQQQLKTVETNLTYANIFAPFDGTIGISQVRLGNLITPGTTLLNTISTDNPMAVDFLVNEAQLSHFLDLQKHKQQDIDSLFSIILPDQKIYPYQGKISIIDRAVDPQTGSITVRCVFPNPDFSVRAGMSCIMRVHNQESTPKLVIPNKAVVEQMGEYFVYVAKDTTYTSPEDTTKKNAADTVQTPKLRAFQVKVQLGQTIGPNVIVESGIEEGDRIVVDGVQLLHDGSLINASGKKK
jgi:membrane fusion protein (multidrug efflux system)